MRPHLPKDEVLGKLNFDIREVQVGRDLGVAASYIGTGMESLNLLWGAIGCLLVGL
jgi:hypothetical protein